ASPLPYVDGKPVRESADIGDRQTKLESFHFQVSVDGLYLQRPVSLPPRADQKPPSQAVTTITLNSEVDGSPLRGSGYIYSQGGQSIYPAELRGMLIRIKSVAIGDYDKSFLDYPILEGPRFGWLSGEL